ncbi:hypothetical protein P692DRAFT_20444380 [Suillus brevipes Sb2]|nr:hypothetical protein P692DRAFT_20444380 [Suillus brevipes Sb2]
MCALYWNFLCIVMIRRHGSMTEACGATDQVSDICSAHPLSQYLLCYAAEWSLFHRRNRRNCYASGSSSMAVESAHTSTCLATRTPRKSRWK